MQLLGEAHDYLIHSLRSPHNASLTSYCTRDCHMMSCTDVRTHAMELEAFEATIKHLFSQGWTYERISAYIQQLTGRSRGFSCRTVRRFCRDRGMLLRHTLGDVELDQCVILRVGHAYGRKTMQGLLRSHGIVVSQSRIAASLRRVAPIPYHARRADAHRMLNPFPYHASH